MEVFHFEGKVQKKLLNKNKNSSKHRLRLPCCCG